VAGHNKSPFFFVLILGERERGGGNRAFLQKKRGKKGGTPSYEVPASSQSMIKKREGGRGKEKNLSGKGIKV